MTGWERRRKEYERATPKWINRTRIRKIYDFASRHGRHVDHIVPLNSPLVCGLHCEDNLQVLLPRVNYYKSNTTWPDMWNEQTDWIELPDFGLQLSLF